MAQKIIAGMIGLTFSSMLSAGTQGEVKADCVPDGVTIPCEAKQWHLGVDALYLRPTFSGERTRLGEPDNYRTTDNDWDWGYALHGSYHFGPGNDVALHWIHFDATSDLGRSVAPLPDFGATGFAAEQLNTFDRVNLVFGQHADFGVRKDIRYYAGLQYADIRSLRTSTYDLPAAAGALGISGVRARDNADFNGVGPVIGMDFAYKLSNGVSLTANTAGAILYGTGRNQTQLTLSPSGLVQESGYGSKKDVVPAVEAKLGLAYSHTLAAGTLTLTGGYQAINYFNALPLITGNSSDFGLYGPYAGLHWLADV